ncbi:MAG: glycosyltransferase family 9 protein [Elusimicrobia bacterium]|nr:glycosyltransferase family 9 protein [Elusimicrobiota bacterium]
MRRSDFWAGQVLCFGLTWLHRLTSLLGIRRDEAGKPVRRILLIKLSEMGAIVLANPLILDLKKRYPDATIAFLTFSENLAAFRLLNDAIRPQDIFTIETASLWRLCVSSARVLSALRRRKVDVAIDLEFFSRLTAILAFLSGAWQRVGFHRYHFEGLYRGDLLTHKVQFNPMLHCSLSYLSLAAALAEPRKDAPGFLENIAPGDLVYPRFAPTQAGRARIRESLRSHGLAQEHLILIHPGEGVLPEREWPLENFIELSRRLLREDDRAVLVIGSRPLTGKDKALQQSVGHPKCLNLVGETSIEDLLELACLSRILISSDCGLPHMVSLTPCPKIVIFGPESPMVFSPVGPDTRIVYSHFPCSPCLSVLNHRESSCRDNRCLQTISVNEVFGLAQSILSGSRETDAIRACGGRD